MVFSFSSRNGRPSFSLPYTAPLRNLTRPGSIGPNDLGSSFAEVFCAVWMWHEKTLGRIGTSRTAFNAAKTRLAQELDHADNREDDRAGQRHAVVAMQVSEGLSEHRFLLFREMKPGRKV